MFPLDEQRSIATTKKKSTKSLKGVFAHYGDDAKIALEDNAWQANVINNYKKYDLDIANQLLKLIDFDNISTSNHSVIKKALELFHTENLDFVDCLLCSYSQQDEIITFDKKLNKCLQNF